MLIIEDKRIYKPLDYFTNEQIEKILQRYQIDELITLPLPVGENHTNWKYAQDLCVRLSDHENPIIRANAVLGLAYIARTKLKLEKHIVKPIILRELRENHEYNWRITDAIDDINRYMKWRIGSKEVN